MTPFTFEEASEICEDFEDLKDTEFNIGTSTVYLIHDVTISPFKEEDKRKFIYDYFAAKDSGKPLRSYSGSEYDVLLLAYNLANETDFVHIDIRTFTNQRGITYNFPVHS